MTEIEQNVLLLESATAIYLDTEDGDDEAAFPPISKAEAQRLIRTGLWEVHAIDLEQLLVCPIHGLMNRRTDSVH